MFTEPHTSSAKATAEPAATRKFLFERSFDASTATRAPERKPVTLKPDQYDALKKEAYDQGFAAGQQAGLDAQTDRLMSILAQVDATIQRMLDDKAATQKENEAALRKLALVITRKFVPELAARNGLPEIEAMLSAVISDMIHEPRLVVRVYEGEFDVLNDKISTIARQKAYAGKIVLLADPEIAAGDCRIEWADGGMERNTDARLAEVEKTLMP